MKKAAWIWLGAFAVKLLLLAVFVFPKGQGFVDRYDPEKQFQQYDDREYVQVAKRLVTYKTFTIHFGDPSYRTVFRMPGYPAFLAVVGVLCRWNLFAMLIAQAALFSFLPVLLWLLFQQLKLPGWVAWICVFDPLLNIISVTFMTEGLYCLFLLGGFFCFLKGKHLGFRFGAYILLALAILIKPTVQYFYIILIVGGLLLFPRRWVTVALIILSLLPVCGWLVRNHDVTGEWILSTQSDNMILAIPIMEEARGDASQNDVVNDIVLRHKDDYVPPFREMCEGSLSGLLRDNKFDFKEETKEYLLEHPILFVRCHLSGMVRVLFGTMREHVEEVFFLGERMPRWFSLGYSLFIVGFYFAVYLLIAAGFRWTLIRNPAYLLALLFVGYNVALIGIFSYMTGGGLKRLPFIPFLYILAGFAAKNLEMLKKYIPERLCVRLETIGKA